MKTIRLFLLLSTSGLFAQDVTSIAADRTLWPKTVVVSVRIKAPVIIAGKASGSIKLPAGREYPVSAVGAESVTVDVGGSLATVAAGETDLPAKAAAGGEAREAQQAKNTIAVYYSASCCGPCRGFTPDLAKWYQRHSSKSELFELVFVSADRSGEQMQEFMIEDKMPWPAILWRSMAICPTRPTGQTFPEPRSSPDNRSIPRMRAPLSGRIWRSAHAGADRRRGMRVRCHHAPSRVRRGAFL